MHQDNEDIDVQGFRLNDNGDEEEPLEPLEEEPLDFGLEDDDPESKYH